MRLEQLIRAYISPHLRLCSEPDAQDYVRLLARFITEDSEVMRRIYAEILEPVRSMYLAALAATLPRMPQDELERLFSFMVVLMVSAPADASYSSMTGRPAWPKESERLTEQLVSFITAGFLHRAQATRSSSRPRSAAQRSARSAGSEPVRKRK